MRCTQKKGTFVFKSPEDGINYILDPNRAPNYDDVKQCAEEYLIVKKICISTPDGNYGWSPGIEEHLGQRIRHLENKAMELIIREIKKTEGQKNGNDDSDRKSI